MVDPFVLGIPGIQRRIAQVGDSRIAGAAVVGLVEQDVATLVTGDVGCTDVILQSSSISLYSFVGKIVDLSGQILPGSTAPLIEVETLQETDEEFRLNSNPVIGGELRLEVKSEIGIYYYFVASLQPGFTPLDALFANISGTFFLDVNSFVLLFAGPLDGQWEERLPVPDNPQLVGLRIWAQSAVQTAAGNLYYLNPDCAVVGSSGHDRR